MSEIFEDHNEIEPGETYKIVEELSLNRPADVREVRGQISVQVRGRLTAHPANVCDRGLPAVTGTSRELRASDVTAVFTRPLAVGSIFQIAFDKSMLDIPPALAMCKKCAMLGDEAFDTSLAFLHPIELPDNEVADTD